MQNAVPKGEGGMIAVLGSNVKNIEKLLSDNKENFFIEIANDNSDGQIVLSGKNKDLEKLIKILKSNSIKTLNFPLVLHHCKLMNKATKYEKN